MKIFFKAVIIIIASIIISIGLFILSSFIWVRSLHNTDPEFILGNLNGTPVKIPIQYNFLFTEYDDSAYWIKNPSKKKLEQRDFNSSISSLALRFHYPDFEPLNFKNKLSYVQYENNPAGNKEWLYGGVNAGIYFSKKITRAPNINGIRAYLPPDKRVILGDYIKTEKKMFDLQVFEERKDSPRPVNQIIFMAYRNNVRSTEITCRSDRPLDIKSNSCTHRFLLNPEIDAEAQIRYPASNLKNWEFIENGVREKIISFIYKQSK